ncbi:unnamed protein product [Kuraishia capsulata CBS 1993]|uniref:Nitrite reductase [NAD(P)H] n=1 Tax=Kuraishia capsulata CBS 1993 TaxID=1382522 RepID=W6MSD2_9ASCO|nr:uncharacterized protein KUCA_T00000681001 [Kuraishia capsulata CBS 1993]CDK24715.1 unnamed protein product [Kuraishia capsulata CBS 1993]
MPSEAIASSHGIPPLPGQTNAGTDALSKHLVIVGLGMVGIAFLEKMLMNDEKTNLYKITILGEEPYLAYNRVGLTEYFQHRKFANLLLSPESFYESRNTAKWDYRVDEAVVEVNDTDKWVKTSSGDFFTYDQLVFATGSTALLPMEMLPVPKSGKTTDISVYRKMGCFVYRSIDDLNSMLQFSDNLGTHVGKTKRAIVVGGGLLGLEAAKALLDMNKYDNVTVVHRSGWLLSQQMDSKGGALLTEKVRELGVTARTGTLVEELIFDESQNLTAIRYNNGEVEDCQLLCYTIGIKPRDELASAAGIDTAPRGGIAINNFLESSSKNIFAIGECASWNDKTFGLIAPGVAMADVLAFNLTQAKNHAFKEFSEPDIGTRLKLMGVDVASFGDYFADKNGPKWLPAAMKKETDRKSCLKSLVFEDPIEGKYTKLIVTKDGKYLLGGILVGDTSNFTKFTALAKSRKPLPMSAAELIIGKPGDDGDEVNLLTDDTQVCSCHNVTKGSIAEAVKSGKCKTIPEIKKCTKAGTACGGCEPTIKVIFEAEMKKLGNVVANNLCIHFKQSRSDLFSVIMVRGYKSFSEVMRELGEDSKAAGCEICKPTIGSILSTLFNRHLLEADVHGLQETNDRYLGNIQRNGTYSVIPRVSAGEITPEKLIAIGEVAKKFDVYTKITGAQRIDLFGVKKQDLISVWEDLESAGFESGQGYGKTLRSVKSCVGSTWCRYGIGDSVGLAIRLEERYKGIRSPHKLKGGVSGCVRDCAEFNSKDFGLCAVQNGFNVFVGGNGGMKPAHAQLLQADCPPDQVIPLLDRYLMFYFRTADRLQRTARWVESLDGGIEYVKDVVVRDKLGIAKELEEQMQKLVGMYYDEWSKAVQDQKESPVFKQFVNTEKSQDTVEIIRERGQRRPADWPDKDVLKREDFKSIVWSSMSWKEVCDSSVLPDSEAGSSATVLISDTQIALFKSRGKLFASQNMCGHKRAFVLSQGILSTDEKDNTYISCPLHKRNYVLDQNKEETGSCKNDPAQSLATFDIKEENGKILVRLPPDSELDEILGTSRWKVKKEESVDNATPFKRIDQRFKIKVPTRAIPAIPAGCGNDSLDW